MTKTVVKIRCERRRKKGLITGFAKVQDEAQYNLMRNRGKKEKREKRKMIPLLSSTYESHRGTLLLGA